MRRRQFTLVELLVVIGIIAVLAGILMTAIMYAPQKADHAKAMSQVTTLVNAIKQFESTYGYFPIPDGELTSADGKLSDEGYNKMIAILQGETKYISASGTKTNLSDKDLRKNKKKQKFLDVQGNETGLFNDPWAAPYVVYFDYDYDGKISTDVTSLSGSPYHYSVIVMSEGKNKAKDDDNIYSISTKWDSKNKKNVITK